MEERNYITPPGLKALKDELQKLLKEERPEVTATVSWAASNGDRSENGDYLYGKRRLRQIDKRIHHLRKRIDLAFVVDPATIKANEVRFGATVELEDDEGRVRTFQIVGVDETDTDHGKISWRSPIASALLKAKATEGDYVTYKSPKGELGVEVLRVEYR